MVREIFSARLPWLIAGVAVGLAISMFAPSRNVQAVATDTGENFAICTGSADGDTEAVFTLDFLSGDLRGAVINPVTKTFAAGISRNILKDLKIEQGKTPKFLMVTAAMDLRSIGGTQMGSSVVCVAELNSGMMGIYAYPYSQAITQARTGVAPQLEFIPLQVFPIRTTTVRQ